MKITFAEIVDRNSWTGWAILHLMSNYKKEMMDVPEWAESFNPENKEVDVVMTINGVEVNFDDLMKRFGATYDEHIATEARKIVQEQFGNMLTNLSSLIDATKMECVNEIHKKYPGLSYEQY